jgi:hypothetical protein
MGSDMSRLARILLFALALLVTLAPISCKKPVAPPDAAKLSSKDYGTRARAIEQLMRSDVSTTGKFSDKVFAEVDRAVTDFHGGDSSKSYSWLRKIQKEKQENPFDTAHMKKSKYEAIIIILADDLDNEGVPK